MGVGGRFGVALDSLDSCRCTCQHARRCALCSSRSAGSCRRSRCAARDAPPGSPDPAGAPGAAHYAPPGSPDPADAPAAPHYAPHAAVGAHYAPPGSGSCRRARCRIAGSCSSRIAGSCRRASCRRAVTPSRHNSTMTISKCQHTSRPGS